MLMLLGGTYLIESDTSCKFTRTKEEDFLDTVVLIFNDDVLSLSNLADLCLLIL